MKPCVVTHGGAGSPAKHSDGCERAARAAQRTLSAGGDAWAAAIAATVVLEDDVRFNAGTGSVLRLDGTTVQMDAAIAAAGPDAESPLRFGAVIGIERVQHPVLVAARVADTPHMTLAGHGATAFARRLGFADYDPTTPAARKSYERALAELAGKGSGAYADAARPWRDFQGESPLEEFWNFPGQPPRVAPLASRRTAFGRDDACDTVGAVVRDAAGCFAATASTGGTRYTLLGRVGDSPQLGAGLYAGPAGAVAATGIGEIIVQHLLAKRVYDWLADGVGPRRAAERAVALFPQAVDVGLLVVSRRGHAVASNRSMASAVVTGS